MTPDYTELVAATRQAGEALASAAALGLDRPVPTCGDWDVRRLLAHTGRVYRFAAGLLESRSTEPGERAARMPDGADALAWYAEGLDRVVVALAAAEPGTPVWNWSVQPDTASFWARRMAHEAQVHAWDAQAAHGVAATLAPDLAIDGIDELFDVMVPRAVERMGGTGLAGTLALVATDAGPGLGDGRWLIELGEDAVRVAHGSGEAGATVHGRAGDLLLQLYGRLPAGSELVTVDGDRGLLEGWQQRLAF